jgi:hypothetical protein
MAKREYAITLETEWLHDTQAHFCITFHTQYGNYTLVQPYINIQGYTETRLDTNDYPIVNFYINNHELSFKTRPIMSEMLINHGRKLWDTLANMGWRRI